MTASGDLHRVRYEPNFLIPLEDGNELAASAFVPDLPGRWPALVTCYPYHKDEAFGAFIEPANRYFAARGYVSVIVDLRGTGGSTGALPESFRDQGADCAAAVEWVAEQPWCDGNIGMWGISYGGITALSAAAAQPPHLRAIAPIFGCTDQYLDSLSPGGCPKMIFPTMWANTQVAHRLSPPMHQDVGGRWYKIWTARMEGAGEQVARPWHERLINSSYWQDKATDVGQIRVPTFLIGGWRDMFADVPLRVLERLQVPCRVVIGPWLHEFPSASPVAPIDHLGEMCRWWDEWLRGENTGIMDEPAVTLYVQGSGVWAQEAGWPPARREEVTLFLGAEGDLRDDLPEREASLLYLADPTVGVTAGHQNPGGAPLDQGPDDLRSLVFTTEPLARPILLAGGSEAVLHVAIDEAGDANLVVKLCDLGPDGSSTLITTGWLKASHRLSHESPEEPERGRLYEYRVPIWATAYEIAEGHRLRVAFSCSDFPRIWPTPENPAVRVHVGGAHGSCLRLQTAVLSPAQAALRPAVPPSVPPGAPDGEADWMVRRRILRDEVTVEHMSRSVVRTPGGDRVETEVRSAATVASSHPEGARCESATKVRLALPSGGEAVVDVRSHVTQRGIMVAGRVERDGHVIFEKRWPS